MRLTRVCAVVFAAALVASACGSSKSKTASSSEPPRPPTTTIGSTSTSNTDGTTATGKPNLAAVHVKLTTIVSGLDRSLDVAQRTGDPALYVANQTGTVVAVLNGHVLSPP